MNRQHPIDDLFRSRLEEYGQEAPMHVWDAIERSRLGKPRRKLLALWLLLPATVIGTVVLGMYLSGDVRTPEIGSFPIYLEQEKATAEATATEAPAEKTAPVQVPPDLKVESVAEKTAAQKSVIPSKKSSDAASAQMAKIEADAQGISNKDHSIQQTEQVDANKNTTHQPRTAQKKWTSPALLVNKADLSGDGYTEMPKRTFPTDPQCARFSRGYWYHYVDLTVAPGFAFRNFEALDSEYENYLKQREKTEKSRYAISAGVRLTAVSGTGLAASAGLNYTRITEAFDYLNENEILIIIRDLRGPNGEFLGRDTSYQTGTRRIVKYNQYQMLEVPLAVGYNIRGSKFDLMLSAGVRLNLLFLPKGAFLSPEDLRPVNFSYDRSDAYPAFKKHLEAGWFLNAGLAYKWKTDFHFLLEPHLSYYPREFTRPDYPISQKYWLMGVSVGIRKRL